MSKIHGECLDSDPSNWLPADLLLRGYRDEEEDEEEEDDGKEEDGDDDDDDGYSE